jgi:hypothetical protein
MAYIRDLAVVVVIFAVSCGEWGWFDILGICLLDLFTICLAESNLAILLKPHQKLYNKCPKTSHRHARNIRLSCKPVSDDSESSPMTQS